MEIRREARTIGQCLAVIYLNLDPVTYALLHAILEKCAYARTCVHTFTYHPAFQACPTLLIPQKIVVSIFYLRVSFFFPLLQVSYYCCSWLGLTGACCINSHPGRNTSNSRRASEESKGLQGSASCVLYRSILC